MTITSEDLASMTKEEFARFRTDIAAQVAVSSEVRRNVWQSLRETYGFFKEQFIQTGDMYYLEKMLEKVEWEE
jgi:hypothetical protein